MSDQISEKPVAGEGADRLIVKGAELVTVASLVVMTAIVGWQVFGRFVLNDTPKWSEQLAGILMVYLTLIGAAVAVRNDGLIALDAFLAKFPVKLQIACRLIVELLILAFAVLMIVYGARMAVLVEAWTVPTLGFSRSVNYWGFPIAGAMMLLFTLRRIASRRFLTAHLHRDNQS
ncbi:TRAP transporter small permease [Pseudokordiimonas caeni]|uniref:TRAP transporter small permease n=1 Tax=Pseudokordiimonas caeni TaxID=2997908 RepID=UPI002810CC6C|nr:TRAP transporter small permease [Pseudokordiimonas caeni]